MTSMQLVRLVIACIGLSSALLGAVCGIVGWALPLRDGSARYAWRFLSWGFATISFFILLANSAAWYWKVGQIIGLVISMTKCGHWWRQMEDCRRANRALRARGDRARMQ